ncbi:MAG: phage shock protein E [Saprospiraceae bacterium]
MSQIKSAGDLIAEAQKEICCVSIEQAKKLYESDSAAVIVDVRDADAAATSKLANSENISRGLLEMKIEKLCVQSDALILTHCGGGGRASLAAQSLQKMGYTNVHAITAKYDDIKAEFG